MCNSGVFLDKSSAFQSRKIAISQKLFGISKNYIKNKENIHYRWFLLYAKLRGLYNILIQTPEFMLKYEEF